MKELAIKYDKSNDFITHDSMKVFNNKQNDYGCDIILQMNNCLYPSFKQLLINKVDYFKKMFDEAIGWSESGKLELYKGLPIVNLE